MAELERLGHARHRLVGRRAGRRRELPMEGQVLVRPPEPGDARDPPRCLRRFPAQAAREVPLGQVPLPREHRSRAAARRADAGPRAEAGRVRHDELLDSGQEAGAARSSLASRRADGQRQRGARAERGLEYPSRRQVDSDHGPSRVVIKQGEHGALLHQRRQDLLRAGLSPRDRCSTPPVPATPLPAGSWRTWPEPGTSPTTTSAARWCMAPPWARTPSSSSAFEPSTVSPSPTWSPASAPSGTSPTSTLAEELT